MRSDPCARMRHGSGPARRTINPAARSRTGTCAMRICVSDLTLLSSPSSAIRAYPAAAPAAIRKPPLLEPAQLLVHAQLSILMRVAVAGLRADAQLPRPVVEAEIRAALPLPFSQEAAEVHRATDTAEDHVLFSRQQYRIHVDFAAGHAVLIIMDSAEGSVERMLAVEKQPTGEIALDYEGVAVGHVVPARDVQMRPRIEREIGAALEAPEVEPRKTAAARRQRALEAVADPQLIAGRAREATDVWRDALLDLRALLQHAVFVADKAAAEHRRLQQSGALEREESRIGFVEPLGMCGGRDRDHAQRGCEGDRHANAGNSFRRHVSPPPLTWGWGRSLPYSCSRIPDTPAPAPRPMTAPLL